MFVEKLESIHFDKDKLQDWLTSFLKTAELDDEPTQYLDLTVANRADLNSRNQVGSYPWEGSQVLPRWKLLSEDEMLPSWLNIDFSNSKVAIDLETARKIGALHPLSETSLSPQVSGYLKDCVEELTQRGFILGQGWLGGFKSEAFYRKHLHTLKNCYNFILHIPIVSGPEFELYFHEQSQTTCFNEFQPGRCFIIDPRVWHSAKFKGQYFRWHACFNVYDTNAISQIAACSPSILNKHKEIARAWEQYLIDGKGPNFIAWDDQL